MKLSKVGTPVRYDGHGAYEDFGYRLSSSPRGRLRLGAFRPILRPEGALLFANIFIFLFL